MAKNTKEKILNTGIEMWLENYMSVNAYAIAKRLGITHGAVLYHFPNGVKDAVAEYAVETQNCKIICQLIVLNHKTVSELTNENKSKYLASF